jgi:glycosyltransferase involved in cell wall biosynthesis
VLDNCSSDGSSEMLEQLIVSENYSFKHIRHQVNIGASANAMRAYEIVTEEYVWLLCDDDDCEFSMFSEVKSVLKENNPDIIVVGSPINISPDILFRGNTRRLLQANDLKETELVRLLTFLPSAIIKNKKIKNCDFGVGYNLSHTYFPQFFWISKVFNNNWSVFIMPRTIIKRPPIAHGLESDFTHVNGYLKGIDLFKEKDLIEHSRNLYFGFGYAAYAKFIAKLMIREKIAGKLKVENYFEHLFNIDLTRRIICFLMCFVFFIPVNILIVFKSIKKRFDI